MLCDNYYSKDDVITSSDRLSYFERNIKTGKGSATTTLLWTHNSILVTRKSVSGRQTSLRASEELATITKTIWLGIILLRVMPSHSRTTAERTGNTKRFKTAAKILSKATISNTWWVSGSRDWMRQVSTNKYYDIGTTLQKYLQQPSRLFELTHFFHSLYRVNTMCILHI